MLGVEGPPWLRLLVALTVVIGMSLPERAEPPAPEAPDPPPTGAYDDRVVMVAPYAPDLLTAIAERQGTLVAREVGPSGYGALRVPEDLHALIAALRADPGVRGVARMGRTHGAKGGPGVSARATQISPAQWHLSASNASRIPTPGLDAVVVAVLDTGVAYENRSEGGVQYVQAPSLRDVRFVAPRDFIHGDAHPLDDHQHGTHIASLIASMGPAMGVAPGVAIMPVKVLDEDDVGTELALIDGIHHAVDHGADVINMSLSFGTDYVPSDALVHALERAANAGIVLVSAAGNEGTDRVTQPAANPLVIAVGAIRPGEAGGFVPAAYGNVSPRVDLVAPGGSVDEDRNHDGYLDGLLAETIALRDPRHVGYWLYAGTSQAAALVSGTAALLVHAGLSAEEVRVALQAGSAANAFAPNAFTDGYGRGRLDVGGALAVAVAGTAPAPRDYYVSMLAWLERGPGGLVRPTALVTVLDANATRVGGVKVAGTLDGVGGGVVECLTDAGTCRVQGTLAFAQPTDSWVFRIDAIIAEGIAFRPGTALFANSGLQALIGELRRNTELDASVLGFHWPEGSDPALGPVADSHLLVSLGVGRATSPTALLVGRGVFAAAESVREGSLLITGPRRGAGPTVRAVRGLRPGLARYILSRFAVHPSDALALPLPPLEVLPALSLQLPDGLSVVSVDADRLRTTPLAISARAVFTGDARGYQPILVGTGQTPGPLQLNRRNGVDLSGTPIGDWLKEGGWHTRAGQPAAPPSAHTGASAGVGRATRAR